MAGGRGGALLSGLLGDLADSLVWERVSGVGAALIIRQLIGHARRLKTERIRTQQLRHWRPGPQRRCRWSGFPRQWRRGWWVRVCHASANTEGGHAQRTSEAGSCQQVPDTHAQSLPSSYVSQTGSAGGRISRTSATVAGACVIRRALAGITIAPRNIDPKRVPLRDDDDSRAPRHHHLHDS